MPHNLPPHILLSYAIWHIWNNRNKNIFENITETPNPYKIISQAAVYFYIIQKEITKAQTRSIYFKWRPPPGGYYKLNTDGSSQGTPRRNCLGGVIRNSAGNWIVSFTGSRQAGNSTHMEICALLTGLQIAWLHNLTPLEVNVNSTKVISLLQNHNMQLIPFV